MISSLTADALVEGPLAASALVMRKAVMHDIRPILALINGYAAKGLMLPRTEFEMSEAIRDFTVATTAQGEVVGCGALHFYTPTVGEIRSLAAWGAGWSNRWSPRLSSTSSTRSSPSLMLRISF
jgi:amino-acid N-acetyltransferase